MTDDHQYIFPTSRPRTIAFFGQSRLSYILLLLLSRAGRNRRYGPWRGRNAPAAHQRRSTCTYYVRRAPYGGSLSNRRGFACASAPAGTAPRRRGRQNRGAREEAQMTPTFSRKGCPPRPRERATAATVPPLMDPRSLVAIVEL